MPALPDRTAVAFLENVGSTGIPLALGSRWLGLFSTPPTTDSGVTGATEFSGSGYARVQIAGALSVSASSGAPSTGSASITLAATAPAWLLALGTNGSGCNVYDTTNGLQIGTVSTISGTTVTLTGNASNNGALSDSLYFSAFSTAVNSSGTEPTVTPAYMQNGAAIAFAQSTGAWSGNAVAWGIFDAATVGNNLWWDWMGAFPWSPFTCTNASPGVLTCTDQTFVNSQFAAVTAKLGGTMPTTSGSWVGPLTVAGVSGATFYLGVNTTSTGDGLVRQVTQ